MRRVREMAGPLKRRIMLLAAIPLLCVAGCLAYVLLLAPAPITYTATARIIVSSRLQEVAGIAEEQVRKSDMQHPECAISSTVSSGRNTLSIIVQGPKRGASIELANEIAHTVHDESVSFVPDTPDNPFNAKVEEAAKAKRNATSTADIVRYALIALAAGAVVAAGAIAVLDRRNRPIKSASSVGAQGGMHVLDTLPVADGGERLLALTRFSVKKAGAIQVAVVPLVRAEDGRAVVSAFDLAMKNAGEPRNEGDVRDAAANVGATCSVPFTEGPRSVYAAKEADAAIVAARLWRDSLTTLERAVAEMKNAGANLIGVVLVRDDALGKPVE